MQPSKPTFYQTKNIPKTGKLQCCDWNESQGLKTDLFPTPTCCVTETI